MSVYYFSMLKNYEILDAELGKIAINLSKRARRISFRGENGAITAIIPHNYRGNIEYLQRLINENRAALKRLLNKSASRHESSMLYDGKRIEIVEGTLTLRADCNIGRGRVRSCKGRDGITFLFHPDDLLSTSFQQGLVRYIMRTLTTHYGATLRQMIYEQATQLGIELKDVRLGRGQRILGHCSRSGIITVSSFVLLLPHHLRQYIINHELAHLTHFNHSPAFHSLCNEYCQGNEAAWVKELHNFHFPISL